MKNLKKLLLTALLTAVATLLCLELIGLASVRLLPSLYASPHLVAAIQALEPTRFRAFTANAGSPTLGWDNVPGSTVMMKDCLGGTHAVTYDLSRARVFTGYDKAAVTTILIGDSYTHGDEVGGDDTIAAHLLKQHGIMAANLGVAGYSPLQAVLKAKERRSDYPQAHTIVLGVMYENILRNVNGYLPGWVSVDLDNQPYVFGLRPYMQGTTVHQLAPEVIAELPAFKASAIAARATDFWARPIAKFPYSVALLRALGSNSGMIRIRSGLYKMLGRVYEADYRDERLTVPLFAVISDFFRWSEAHALQPVVVFIPQNSLDRSSAGLWIREFGSRLPSNGLVVDARMDGADWSRFNQKPDPACHPSSYGYATIARAYATALKPLLSRMEP